MVPLCFTVICAGLSSPKPGDAWLIRPGHSIGRIYIGEQELTVLAQCGPPDRTPEGEGRTAMGRRWETWRSRTGHELDVYSQRGINDSAAHPEQFVRQVRVDSPAFHTTNGIHVGFPLTSIPRGSTEVKISNPAIRLFDDPRQGIAFEMKKGTDRKWRCSAIVIHPKGRAVLEEYLGFPAYQ